MIRFTAVRIHTATQSTRLKRQNIFLQFSRKMPLFFSWTIRFWHRFESTLSRHVDENPKSYGNNSMKMCVFFVNSICRSSNRRFSATFFSDCRLRCWSSTTKCRCGHRKKLFIFGFCTLFAHYLVWPKRLWTRKCGTLFCVTINA